MGFSSWLKLGKNKNKDVNLVKIKEASINIGEMAAGHQTGAANALNRMLNQATLQTKLLMVQDGEYAQQVSQYALKMAQRLDCEIIALDISNRPLQYLGERQARESERFQALATSNAESFLAQAKAQGIQVRHLIKIGNQEEAIAQLSHDDAGIRYVLTKPDHVSATNQEQIQVPVFDLRCSRL